MIWKPFKILMVTFLITSCSTEKPEKCPETPWYLSRLKKKEASVSEKTPRDVLKVHALNKKAGAFELEKRPPARQEPVIGEVVKINRVRPEPSRALRVEFPGEDEKSPPLYTNLMLPEPEKKTSLVKPADLKPSGAGLSLTCRLQPARRVDLIARVPGTVKHVLAEEASQVKKGQSILLIRDDVYRAEYEAAAKNLKVAEKLRKRSAMSELDYKRAVAEYKKALDSLEATRLKAPFDGVITKSFVQPGQNVMPGSMLVTVIDSQKLDALADVPESHLSKLETMKRAEITLSATGQTYSGYVFKISPTVDPGTNTCRVYIRINNRDGKLKPGFTGKVKL